MFLAKGKIYIFIFILLYYSFSGFVADNFAANSISSYGLVIVDAVLICLGILSLGKQKNKVFSIIFLIFIVSSTITFFINHTSLITHLNGLREYLIIISSILFLNHVFNSKYFLYFHSKFIFFCWLFIILQVPISLIQFMQHGAGDAVGGGFGNGGSGTLSLCTFLIIFFLNCHFSIKSGERNFPLPRLLLFVPFLLPTFINETKLTFVLIGVFFVLLLEFKFTNVFKISVISLIAVSLFFAYEFIYTSTTAKNNYFRRQASYERIFSLDFLDRYLSSEEISRGTDVSRLTKINIAYLLICEDPGSFLFGKGLGLFKGGSVMESSRFSKKFDWLLSGTRPYLFFLLIQGGVIGTLLIIIFILAPIYKSRTSSTFFIINRMRIFLIFLFMVILVYNPAFRTGGFVIFFSYLSLFCYNSTKLSILQSPFPRLKNFKINPRPHHA